MSLSELKNRVQLAPIDHLVFSNTINLLLYSALSFTCSRLKRTVFDAVAGNSSTGIETSPKEMLLRDTARGGIC
jgi:hypothetical protein